MVPKVVPKAPEGGKAMQKSQKRIQKRITPAHSQHFGGKMVPREAPRGPKTAPKSVKICKKLCRFPSLCSNLVFSWFLMDFWWILMKKRSRNLHVCNKVKPMLVDVVFQHFSDDFLWRFRCIFHADFRRLGFEFSHLLETAR